MGAGPGRAALDLSSPCPQGCRGRQPGALTSVTATPWGLVFFWKAPRDPVGSHPLNLSLNARAPLLTRMVAPTKAPRSS